MRIPFLFLLAVLFLLSAPITLAQTSDYLIVTWRAENLYPADFAGRAMPTPGSPVQVSAETILGGKLTNSGLAEISWFLDGALLEKGVGTKTVRFTARGNTANSHFLRVQVKVAGKNLEESVRVPVKQVKVAMEIPAINKVLPSNSELQLSAVPYFFNASSLENLVFNWIINNTRQKETGNGSLTLNIGQPQSSTQQKMTIIANVQNLLNPLEVAQERGIFSISQ